GVADTEEDLGELLDGWSRVLRIQALEIQTSNSRTIELWMNLGLTNKVAMVAGASRGLGFAVARALAREGAKVSLSSRSPEAASDAGYRISAETGADVLAVAADVRSA